MLVILFHMLKFLNKGRKIMITGKIISKPSWSTYVQLKPLGIPVSLLAGLLSTVSSAVTPRPEFFQVIHKRLDTRCITFQLVLILQSLANLLFHVILLIFLLEIEIMTCTQSFLCYFPCHHAHHGSSKTENLKTRPRQMFYVSELD